MWPRHCSDRASPFLVRIRLTGLLSNWPSSISSHHHLSAQRADCVLSKFVDSASRECGQRNIIPRSLEADRAIHNFESAGKTFPTAENWKAIRFAERNRARDLVRRSYHRLLRVGIGFIKIIGIKKPGGCRWAKGWAWKSSI
jgi:hypothetical protein